MTAECFQEQYHVLHRKMPLFGSGVEESLEPLAEADFTYYLGQINLLAALLKSTKV